MTQTLSLVKEQSWVLMGLVLISLFGLYVLALDQGWLLSWFQGAQAFDLNFISIRTNNENDFMLTVPRWEDAVAMMGNYGLASNDAMILNMFLCSKIPILITTDIEMAEVASKASSGTKSIFIPDALLATSH